MIWKGYKQVSLKSIVCDAADIRRRTKAAHVAELADDIRKRGGDPIHAPTIRQQDRRLLCGRDRMAALITLKAKKIWVHVVECDGTEAKELELAENIYRRAENRAALIAEMVNLKEQQLRAAPIGDSVPGAGDASNAPPPSDKTVRVKARREVARAAGISPASVKKAEQRARTAHAHAFGNDGVCSVAGCSKLSDAELERRGIAPAAAGPEQPPPNLELFGVPHDDVRGTCGAAGFRQGVIDETDKYLRLALAAIGKLGNGGEAQEIYADVKRVGSRVRSMRPAAICPWCKAIGKLTADCRPCNTQGHVTAEVAARAPKECREAAPAIVMWNGQAVPYADARAGKFPANGASKKARGRTISVQDEAGNEIPLDADEAY